jgi:steroid delta-isomerase-like uncharacterized protein
MSTTVTEIETLADRYGEAWNRQDLDAIVALHAPDGIFHLHVPGSAPVQGREAIRESFAGSLAQLPDVHFEPVRLRAGADFWVLESRMSGTVAAPIEVEGQRLEAPGTRVEVDFVDVIAVADGLLARKDSYLDGLAFQQQMGAAS